MTLYQLNALATPNCNDIRIMNDGFEIVMWCPSFKVFLSLSMQPVARKMNSTKTDITFLFAKIQCPVNAVPIRSQSSYHAVLHLHITGSTEQRPSGDVKTHSTDQETRHILWYPEGSLLCSQKPATCIHPEPPSSSLQSRSNKNTPRSPSLKKNC